LFTDHGTSIAMQALSRPLTFARALCAVALAACASGHPAPSRAPAPGAARTTIAMLRTSIDSMVDAPEFANAHWGILIVDPGRGDTLYSRNAGKLFMPASNMKILTSATALTQLGPDYRYRTTVIARGPIVEGTLHGDLMIAGRGDPSVSDHMRTDAMLPLREIADSLAAHGIQRIAGRVVAGGNAFPASALGYGWSYEDFEDAYSAATDELLFNEGFSELHVRAGAHPGDPVRVETRPARTFPTVRNAATTTSAIVDARGRSRTSTLTARKDSVTWEIVLEGQIVAGDTAVIEVTHHDVGAAYLAALREALADRHIAVDGAAGDTMSGGDTLFAVQSPPLRDILPALMKPSQNQVAEMLFKTIALEATGTGRPDSARAVVQRQLAAWGIPPAEAVVRDGSGLSRYDYITPRTAVRVFDAMLRSPHFPVYFAALPIAGIDGTIGSRMKGTPAQGNIHAKTGTVAMARSLSGYAVTADRHPLIFSVLCNNFTEPVAAVNRVQDAIAIGLASLQLR
jgi:serine-type D-Ala-D-Ala carboxypeptidase/endopeptidase (penicillin-binding protein 4)